MLTQAAIAQNILACRWSFEIIDIKINYLSDESVKFKIPCHFGLQLIRNQQKKKKMLIQLIRTNNQYIPQQQIMVQMNFHIRYSL